MTEIFASPYFIAVLFLIVAFTYSSVGLGGGSSYTALLAIFGFSAAAIPVLSLTLNLLVSSIGSYNFIRNRHARLKLIAPFLITSIPMAYVGGALDISRTAFYWLLLVSLLFVAARIYLWNDTSIRLKLEQRGKLMLSLLSGGILGLIAGIVGIGGGIYLVPLIIVLGLGTEKEAAACGAIFIWLNSASGLASRLQYNAIDLAEHITLIVAVVLGGAAGSFLGSVKYSPRTMEKILGIVILIAIVLLLRKVLFS